MEQLTTERWRATVEAFRDSPLMREFADSLDQLVTRMEAVEQWALSNPEGDKLRAVLWPKREK